MRRHVGSPAVPRWPRGVREPHPGACSVVPERFTGAHCRGWGAARRLRTPSGGAVSFAMERTKAAPSLAALLRAKAAQCCCLADIAVHHEIRDVLGALARGFD